MERDIKWHEKIYIFKLFLIGVGYRGSNRGDLCGLNVNIQITGRQDENKPNHRFIGAYYPLFFLNNEPNKVSHIVDLKLLVKQQKIKLRKQPHLDRR